MDPQRAKKQSDRAKAEPTAEAKATAAADGPQKRGNFLLRGGGGSGDAAATTTATASAAAARFT